MQARSDGGDVAKEVERISCFWKPSWRGSQVASRLKINPGGLMNRDAEICRVS